jgi:mono/diheme cytochrome c family protein
MTRRQARRRPWLALATGSLCLLQAACSRLEPKEPDAAPVEENPGVVEMDGRRFSDDVFVCKEPAGSALAGGSEATYLGGVVTLIESKCVSCHGAGGTPPELTSYELSAEEGPASANRVAAGTMPPGGLSAGEKALFAAWAKAEFPEGEVPPAGDDGKDDGAGDAGAPAGVAVCDKAAVDDGADGGAGGSHDAEDDGAGAALVNYTDDIAALLAAQCTSCHGPGATPPDLSTYEVAKAAGERSVVRSVAKTMPPEAPMAPADIDLLTAWKAAGYPKTR